MNTDKLLITTKELQEKLSCSRKVAERIGNQAEARFQIGRIVRWRIRDIEKYLAEEVNK